MKRALLKEFIETFTWNCGDHRAIKMEGVEELELFLSKAFYKIEENTRQKVKQELYQLDWIKILDEAIKGRPTSFNEDPIREWRNASDQVIGAMMSRAQEKKIFRGLFSEYGAKK